MLIQNNFKNKIKNIEAQIGEILRAPSLDRIFLVLIKKKFNSLKELKSATTLAS